MRSLLEWVGSTARSVAQAPPRAREEILVGALGSVALLALATWLLLRWMARLPADHFVRPRGRPDHPVLAVLLAIARNLGGALLIAVGALLALPGIPGPGVATAVVGFLLLDFPGKRALERRLLARPRIRRAIDGLRARHGQPPLRLDGDGAEPPRREPPTGP